MAFVNSLTHEENKGGDVMSKHHMTSATRRGVLISAAAIAFGLMPVAALAEAWPNGPVQLIVPAKAGGGTDAGARIIAGKLQDQIGTGVAVVNSPGGGGAIAAEQVRTADADGQTLLYYHTGFLSTYHTGGYDHSPIDDFTTVATFPVGGSFALAVKADAPYQTVEDLIEATKANPNKITLGVQFRSGSHFMGGLLTQASGAEFRMVEAGSDADKFVQVQGGQIDAAFVNTPGTLQYVESGDLKILATIAGSPDRDPGAPDYPSFAELGYEEAVYGLDFIVLGPKGMDADTVESINAAFDAALTDPDVSGQLAKMRMPITPMGVTESQARIAASSESVQKTAAMLGLTQ